jgi:hypothetical protein
MFHVSVSCSPSAADRVHSSISSVVERLGLVTGELTPELVRSRCKVGFVTLSSPQSAMVTREYLRE